MPENISVTEAIQLAGRRIYRDDWIAGLTPAERDVMAQYPLGGPAAANSEACAKVARARDRDGRARRQHDRTRNWLKTCGFRTEAGALIDGEALKDALAHEFGPDAAPHPLPTAPLRLDGGLPPYLLRRVDAYIAFSQAEDGTGDAVPPANDLRPAPDPKLEEKSRSVTDASPIPTKPDGEAALGNKRPTGRRGPVPTADKIRDAARSLIANGCIPANTITWDQFHICICSALNVNPSDRGYGLDTIQRAVRSLLGTEKTENTES